MSVSLRPQQSFAGREGALRTRQRRVAGLVGMLATLALMGSALCAPSAWAAQPPAQLSLTESGPSALRVARFDDAATIDALTRRARTFPAHGNRTMVSKTPPPEARVIWPHAAKVDLLPPTSEASTPGAQRGQSSRFQRNAWGLAGRGMSLIGGALSYRVDAAQHAYDELPNHASAHRYREVQRQIDDARYIILALYAAGGAVITESIILLTEESNDPSSARAEIAPTWRNGGPAAYLRISF